MSKIILYVLRISHSSYQELAITEVSAKCLTSYFAKHSGSLYCMACDCHPGVLFMQEAVRIVRVQQQLYTISLLCFKQKRVRKPLSLSFSPTRL